MQTQLITRPNGPAALAATRERVKKYVDASKADNTRRAYSTAWREFVAFCAATGAQSLPARPETLIDYLTHLAEQGRRVSTIEARLAGIVFAHTAAQLPSPTDQAVRIVLQGIRHKLGAAKRQKAPATLDALRPMIAALPTDLRGRRDRALLLVGFAGAFRRSELAALTMDDLRFAAGEMVITLRRSKTDQEGAGFTKKIAEIGGDLCPVAALRAWLRAAKIARGPVWRAVDRWGAVRRRGLEAKDLARIVKRAAEAAGLDSRQFAGHSLRAGFVTQAAINGAPEWQIAEMTGHSKNSRVLRDYIRAAGLGQIEAQRAAFGVTDAARGA